MSDLERHKPTAACLSGWTISQLALGILPEAQRTEADAHLAGCAHCATVVREEQQEVEAAQYERVPETLRARATTEAPQRKAWWWPGMAAVFAASAAAMLVMVLPAGDPDSGVRLKGPNALEASVMRGEEVVINRVPLDRIGALDDGDRLRLHVPAALARWVTVEAWQAEKWMPAFAGSVPEEGWLPFGLTVTAGGETRLRVLGCSSPPPEPVTLSAPPPEGCTLQVFELEVRPR